jgi:hypothetical protein
VLNPGLVLVELFLNFVSLWANRKAVPAIARRLVPMLMGLLPGTLIGSITLWTVSSASLRLATYALLLPLILAQAGGWRRRVRSERFFGVFAGTGVGVLYAATTISGPPLALIFNNQGLTRDEFRAALALFRLVESMLTACVYLAVGLFTRESLAISGLLLPGVLLGLPLGYRLFRRVAPETFRRICMAADGLLVSVGLARAAEQMQLLSVPAGYVLCLAVLVLEAYLLYAHFRAAAAGVARNGARRYLDG